LQSENFIFDGITSEEMGLYNVRMQSGLVETPFMGSKSTITTKVVGKDRPYFHGVNKDVIQFNLQFSLLDEEWTPEKTHEIARWLLHDTYKSFQSSDDLGKYYYVICIDGENLYKANNKGYVELTFESNAPFAFSPIYLNEYDLSSNTTTDTIQIENRSNINKYYYPTIEIELAGTTTNITLKNLSDGGREFSFTGLQSGETISVDNENKYIISDIPAVYRFSNFNKNWFRMVYGINQIEVTGECIITVRTQYPIIQ